MLLLLILLPVVFISFVKRGYDNIRRPKKLVLMVSVALLLVPVLVVSYLLLVVLMFIVG
jgi:hypothetical protein